MSHLNLSPDELLTTTRSVRKRLDLDRPVEMEIIEDCIKIALQAPSASNGQNWQFVVVTDANKKAAIGEFYRRAWEIYRTLPGSLYAINQETEDSRAMQKRIASSGEYLAENMHRVPVMLIPCFYGRMEGTRYSNSSASAAFGSVLPAAWSFMLAARSRGLGSCWTTLHLLFEEECAEVLGIPYEKVTQTCLLPVAYTKGTEFDSAPHKDIAGVLHVNGW